MEWADDGGERVRKGVEPVQRQTEGRLDVGKRSGGAKRPHTVPLENTKRRDMEHRSTERIDGTFGRRLISKNDADARRSGGPKADTG